MSHVSTTFTPSQAVSLSCTALLAQTMPSSWWHRLLKPLGSLSLLMVTCLTLSIASMAEAAPFEAQSNAGGNSDSASSAVVFFTLMHNWESGDVNAVGRTQRVAQEIADATHSPLLELRTRDLYPASFNDTVDQAYQEHSNGATPALLADVAIESYDTIYLCSPNWWSSYPQVFVTWMSQHDFTGKTIYVAVTHMGSSYGSMLHDLRTALPGATIKPLLSMRGNEAHDLSREDIRAQVDRALQNQ